MVAERIDTEAYPTRVKVKVYEDDGPEAEPVLVLVVHFNTGRGVPLTVKGVIVESPNPLTGSTLRRLPWDKYLRLADAAIRFRYAATIDSAREQSRRTKESAQELFGGKTGRKPLPDDHYRRIARRVLELRSEGVGQPVLVIAKEEKQNRNTVAGWVRKARQRGYLPPGRPGRAG